MPTAGAPCYHPIHLASFPHRGVYRAITDATGNLGYTEITKVGSVLVLIAL